MLDITLPSSTPSNITSLVPNISALVSLAPSSSIRHIHCALNLVLDEIPVAAAHVAVSSLTRMIQQFSANPQVDFLVFQPGNYDFAFVKCPEVIVVPYRKDERERGKSVWKRSVADGQLWKLMDVAAAQARESGREFYM